MNRLKRYLARAIIVLIFVITACHKDAQLMPMNPVIIEDSLTISYTEVSFKWRVEYPGQITSMVIISANLDMSDAIVLEADQLSENGFFYVTVSDLREGKKYYYNYEICNPGANYKSEIKSFSTVFCTTPTVTTISVSNITNISALCKGEVVDDGNANVIERGVCWSINHNPSIDDNRINSGQDTGMFSVELSNLTPVSTYYVKAFAKNRAGIAYGDEITFTTSFAPPGSVNSLFSVSDSKQVFFSQGNLQYQASTDTWRFAQNQYDFVGSSNEYISANYEGWIDLFAWGTSGYNHGAVLYQPYAWNSNYLNYYAYGDESNNLYDQTGMADWGYNKIFNGGDKENYGWRTLTKDEWMYVFNDRTTTCNIRYAKANVNGINGIILLPDNWDSNGYNLSNPNVSDAQYESNMFSVSQWVALENTGAVFMPAAGHRIEKTINETGTSGSYWSSSYFYTTNSYNVTFSNSSSCFNNDIRRSRGLSVRLVHE